MVDWWIGGVVDCFLPGPVEVGVGAKLRRFDLAHTTDPCAKKCRTFFS